MLAKSFTTGILFQCLLVSAQLGTPKIPLPAQDLCIPNQVPALKISAPFATCDQSVKKGLAQRHPDQDKNYPQILRAYGYPFKPYNITTKDGYILTVYRITGSPKSKPREGKQAVYLNHGIAAASDTWNFQPGSRNLPFKLADAGYEVWVGNGRGTTYSLGHKKYNANTDLRYWDFSFHEMGMYDVPAVTEKILSETNNKKIFYIGHSMGSTQYFVALSEIPKMNEKFHAGFMLAPIGYIGHMYSSIRVVTVLLGTDPQYQVVNAALMGRIQSAQQLRNQFKLSPGDLCDVTATKCGVCDNLMFALFGYNAPQINNTELPNILAKVPNNICVKQLAHYAQLAATCTFRKYDYGPLVNPKKYGSVLPPDYKLSNIKAPTYFYYGEQDNLGPPNDVNMTASKFSPGVLKQVNKVKDKLFNHADFISAKDADKLLYNKILKEMKAYK